MAEPVTVSKYQSAYYPLICLWWKKHDWMAVPEEYLPLNGFIVAHESKPVCAGWLYNTDSQVAWSEWIVANPDTEWEIRDQCLDKLVSVLVDKANELGKKIILTSVLHKRLVERYEKHGYTVTDKNAVNMVKLL